MKTGAQGGLEKLPVNTAERSIPIRAMPNDRSNAFAGRNNRTRHPLPPLDVRDWMTPKETALTIGCSVATVHRMRRGLISGIEPLPYLQYGRKFVFRKCSIASWRERNEKGGLA
jgi:hypothetical protein